ncbi:Spo0E family sporulation regulatory protein-aspartic acid phosphatase [Clostridium massiliamazoniense]|uniref:Spo0E family sporulation regulatory protein-aspartic acid phosphatase n=1 Tax=Clostridium massiliamazoniense TaxID=1347366 RepID=UPI0006D7C15C|nr:Spo0E family sporulation regulatory protein-aspartic acid phosphatase [Clostridium massiliamazoniense]
MTIKSLRKKIARRQKLLYILLIFLKRTNPLVVSLSQNLDKFIVKEQKYLSRKRNLKQSQNPQVTKLKKVS